MRRELVDLQQSLPGCRGRWQEQSQLPLPPSLLISAFLLDPSLYIMLIKKKEMTTGLFELEAGGRRGSREGPGSWGRCLGGEGTGPLGALGSKAGLGQAPGSGWVGGWEAPRAVASLTPLCLVAWRCLPARCPPPLPPPLGHLGAAL